MQRVRLRWRAIVVIGIGLLALARPASAKEYGLDERPGTPVPSLLEVLRLVKDRSPEVVLGNANVATAQSSMVGARLAGLGNPYLEFLGKSAIPGTSTSVAFDGTLWLPFEIAGQRGTRIAESSALIGFERKNLEVATALAKAAAVRAYGLAAVGGTRLGVLGELLEVASTEASNYAARFAAGDVTARDARLAEVELARYSMLAEETRADLALALSELNRLTGADYSSPPVGMPRPPTISPFAVDKAPTLAASRAEAAFFDRAKERARREGAAGNLSLMLNGGRDEFGQPVVGAGLAYAFPVVRRNQGEQARAEAERRRALVEERLKHRALTVRLRGLTVELEQVRRALIILGDKAEPAALAAVNAAVEMQKAGKSDAFLVLMSRRELGLLRLRRLDLVAREWTITSEMVAISGSIQ
jgi:outer membrane protein, heavy metal efflux system